MNQPINLIAFGTFGNPNGFKQTFFVFSDKDIARNVKTFDLKTDAITLFPKSKIYSIRKELANGINAIAYNVYTFAKEQSSDRGGTFVGSSILYLNRVAEESSTINCLNEFQNNLVEKNVQNDVVVVNHSDNFLVKKPKDFDKLSFHLKEVEDLNFGQSSNKNLVVYSQTNPDNLQQLLKKSIDLLNIFDTIYFTDSEEVATYVNRKGIFQLVKVEGFEQEIQKLHEERSQKRQSTLSEFESEKQKLETDRKRLNEAHNLNLEQHKKIHQENAKKIEESKAEIHQINQKYDVFSKKIDELINGLRSNEKIDSVRLNYNEYVRNFRDSVNQQTPLTFNKTSNHQAKTELRQTFKPTQTMGYEKNVFNHKHSERQKIKLDIFKLLSVALFLLWFGTLAYFLFLNKSDTILVEAQPHQNEMTVAKQPEAETVNTKELSPKPNSELSEMEYGIVAKKIKKDMHINDVVQIIFDANPNDIKSHYSNQVEEYRKIIIEKNKDCFREDSNKYLFQKDTLRYIPSYKKQ